ncbi:kinesin family protein-like protein [Mytilinidion resinicola]|uniref:Kinesin family protein-like protein n=1 Tax=Mytilinidion resinicola TaxID=574789 RepID=A0A6A6XZE4_9PEZI|nr:kinesin family protein-like protein [Mytilinidion resinicola]KAF2801946.1 kinesin family protein-like protein [Mytilinidion resinicola]
MSVRVVARIRPLLKLELDKDTIVTAESQGNEAPSSPTVVRIPNPRNESESFSFQFNSVYDNEATQQQIFDQEVKPTVKHLFNGFDVTIFAYGVTGTGKTHTMRGGKSLADRGVIPRLLSAIYRQNRKIEKDAAGATQVEVAMSYYEIYNDKVFDLFEPPEKRTPAGLPIRDNHGKSVVVGLTERPCTTLKEFEQLYDQANINRSTSATKLNAHSSRSHAILCVKVTQTTETTVRVSTVSAIDLAGSEDNRRTDNNKERLVESSSINKSLFVLAQCVEAISRKQSRIPYRESKMTRILSLGQNNGLTLMILNLAPVRSYHLDTLSSLNFANRTKKIEVAEVENEPAFRLPAKPLAASITGPNIQRQPLRPLAAASNAKIHATDHKLGDKPAKEFSVYSDRNSGGRSSNMPHQNQSSRRTEPHKRPADSITFSSRPSKVGRPNGSRAAPSEPTLSKASIEALIAQRIDEKLAEKALQDTAAAAPALPDELQKRLDALEQRIEEKEDGRGEGLQFLLMAKQHQARNEDASALRMFQLAQPFFPTNDKLRNKMKALEDRIRAKRDAEKASETKPEPKLAPLTAPSTILSLPTSAPAPVHIDLSVPVAKKPAKAKKPVYVDPPSDAEDDDFAPAPDAHHDASYASDDSFHYKPKAARKQTKLKAKKVLIFRDETSLFPNPSNTSSLPPGEQSPRTTHLLRIINSRDVTQIRALKGVGAKKADAIVSCLIEMEEEEVRDLESLALLKGVGGRTVENMRLGLAV